MSKARVNQLRTTMKEKPTPKTPAPSRAPFTLDDFVQGLRDLGVNAVKAAPPASSEEENTVRFIMVPKPWDETPVPSNGQGESKP